MSENNPSIFESLFQQAVHAIDAGDADRLQQLLNMNPELATQRLYSPGSWLRDSIGSALDSFFKDPYLLWFVSEDAVRNKTLPANIAAIAAIIIRKAKEQKAASTQEQLDYSLRLVAWSWVARQCNVQVPLLKVLIDEGAATDSVSNDALVNGNSGAAEYLIGRGARLTLPTALCLGKWEEADNIAQSASEEEKQFSLVLAALNGKAEAVKRLIGYGGIDISAPSPSLYSHATALHHATLSGSLETVKALVEAGADLDIADTIYNGTPLGWAEYSGQYAIADYLKDLQGY